MMDFVREKVCFYSSMYSGRSNMREIIECAHRKGVFGVEMMNFCDELRTPDMSAAKELGRLARGYGLALPVFSAGINLVGDCAKDNFDRLCRYAEICSELEIPILHHTVVPGLNLDASLASDRDGAFCAGVEATLRVNEYASRLGVKTVVENQGYVLNGAKNYLRFLSALEGKVGALLDVGNIFFASETPESLLAALPSLPLHVHLKDYAYCTESENPLYTSTERRTFADVEIGTGDVDLDAVAGLLRDRGYAGLYSLEFVRVKNEAEVDRVLDLIAKVFG